MLYFPQAMRKLEYDPAKSKFLMLASDVDFQSLQLGPIRVYVVRCATPNGLFNVEYISYVFCCSIEIFNIVWSFVM